MGEYVKYKNATTKIGTCENLYYTTYPQYIEALNAGHLKWTEGNLCPGSYAQPDSGFRFRFPFPDEDKVKFGNYNDYDRGIPVRVPAEFIDDSKTLSPDTITTIHIVQQKLVHRQSDQKLILAVVYDIPGGERRRMEEDDEVRSLLQAIAQNHVIPENDLKQKRFYREISSRITKGYRIDQEHTLKQLYRNRVVQQSPKENNNQKL